MDCGTAFEAATGPTVMAGDTTGAHFARQKAPKSERNETFNGSIQIRRQPFEKTRSAEERSLGFASLGFEFPSSGFGFSFLWL
jgi:hypothetical protein